MISVFTRKAGVCLASVVLVFVATSLTASVACAGKLADVFNEYAFNGPWNR